MQTILGAGGSIGLEMARILPDYTDRVRLVGRNPHKVIPSNELFRADLLDAGAVEQAVTGSDVVYLLAGLPYKASTWESQWPVIMRNTLDACRAAGARLVFFDNIYMYDRDHLSPMDETTPVSPTSRKGAVRAQVAEMLMSAVKNGELEGLIARSADFYGPGKQKGSVLTQLVFERLAAGKPAQWLLSADHPHSFTYTPDAARGTALLGNAADAFGEIWHLPTAANPPTGEQWIDIIARELGADARARVVTNTLLTLAGLLIPVMRELKEMAYQYDRDYVFDSGKFNRRFGFHPTACDEGVQAIVAADYR